MLDFWLLIFYIISIQHSPLSPVAEKADFESDPHLARGGFSIFGVKDLRGCISKVTCPILSVYPLVHPRIVSYFHCCLSCTQAIGNLFPWQPLQSLVSCLFRWAQSTNQLTNKWLEKLSWKHNFHKAFWWHFCSKLAALCWRSLQWGTADAEIKVPSGENAELKRSPFKAWSRLL